MTQSSIHQPNADVDQPRSDRATEQSRGYRLRQRWLVGIGSAFVALIATFLMASPASAAGPSYIYTQPGRPSALALCQSACGGIGTPYYPPNNTRATMYCWFDASSSYNGNYSSPRYFWVYIDGKPGLWQIHSSYVYYQTSVPRC